MNDTPSTSMGAQLRQLVNDLLTGYGAVLFSGRRRTGMLFLLATFLQPAHGFYGLLGAVTAHLLAKSLRSDRAYLRTGLFAAAGLLTGLALSLYLTADFHLLLIVPLSAAIAALLEAIFISWLGWRYGIPSTALPFVFATWIGLLTARFTMGAEAIHELGQMPSFLPLLGSINSWLDQSLPNFVKQFLTIVGATSLQTSVLAGVLILIGVLLGTRITAVAMLIGAVIGQLFVELISEGKIGGPEAALTAFNCVFAAGALGGVFVLPNRRGALYALFGVVIVGLLSVASVMHLKYFDLPPLAFPFAVGTILLMWPIRMGLFSGIHLYPLASVGTAEANLRQYWRWSRLRYHAQTIFRFPHFGWWSVTQGVDSLPTHVGIGKFAWDFMLLDETGHSASYPGLSLTDYYGYHLPVLSPANGTVVAVESRYLDNAPQNVETDAPYGNYVSIYHAPGEYSLLCHLAAGSAKVAVGQPVIAGQEIGLVGNSGRSPEPHLHIQMQNDWYPGAVSIPVKWGALFVRRGDEQLFLINGDLKAGDVATDFYSQNPIRLDDYFPFHVIGGHWTYRFRAGLLEHTATIKLLAGWYGRFLLDDEEQRLLAVHHSSHWKIDSLDETDIDYRGFGRKGPLSYFGPALSALPLCAGKEYLWKCDIHGFRLASRVKRILELPGSGKLVSEGYQFQRAPDGSQLLATRIHIEGESGQKWEYDLRFRSGVGLVSGVMKSHGKVIAELQLDRYESRLVKWIEPMQIVQ